MTLSKLTMWSVRFILLLCYIVFSGIIISQAYNYQVDVHHALFQQSFNFIINDAVHQGELDEKILAEGYYAELLGEVTGYGFKLTIADEEIYFNEEFYATRYPLKSQYAIYEGSLPVRINDEVEKLSYSFVFTDE